MAEDSDGTLKAVVICEGDLHDPDFPHKFRSLLGRLKSILDPPKKKKRFLKVDKVEPWNSVRVTLSIPKDAAAKLRQLAAEGSTALRALGILSVQLEGDTVISLRLVGQEIVLRTENENAQALIGQNQNSAVTNDLTNLLARVPTPQNNQQSQQTVCAGTNAEGPSGLSTIKPQQLIRTNSLDPSTAIASTNGPIDTKSIFKSPNTICPMDGKLPTPVPSNIIDSREYPFESMTQARVIQRRENTLGQQIQSQQIGIRPNIDPAIQPPLPPPPYPGATMNAMNTHMITNKVTLNQQQQASTSGNIAISSPLLVNLLQNESAPSSNNATKVPPNNSTITNTNIGPPTILPNTQTAIVKNGQEIVILSNNSLPHQPLQPPQVNQTSNFVLTNTGGGAETGFNKCVVTKQSMQSPSPHHQMRVQQTTFVNVSTVQNPTNESIQQSQQNLHNSSNNAGNVMPPQQQQQANNIVIAGNTSVPSTINNMNVNKIQQSRYSQQQTMPSQPTHSHSQQYQQFTNQSQIRANLMQSPNAAQNHSNQQPMGNVVAMPPNPMSTQPQNIPAQIVLQKQQMRAMHPNMMNQQQQMIGTSMRQVEFRQSAPANVVVQQNQIQSNQVQQFQQQQQQQQQQAGPVMQSVSGNTMQTFNSPLGSQQMNQPVVPQVDSYNPRWPLKPMDSATQSSFQEFARYQMEYNLSQQQQSNTADSSIADHLADLDEITRTDLESLLPSINDTDLDSALELDIKAPLESLLDAKDLELDLIDSSVNETITQTANCAPLASGTGIPQMGVGNPQMMSMQQQNANIVHFQNQQQQQHQQHQQHHQQQQMNIQQQIAGNANQFTKQELSKRTMNMNQLQHTNMMNIQQQSVPSGSLMKQSKNNPITQNKVEQKLKSAIGKGKEKQVLINPLTGELEPILSDDSGDGNITNEMTSSFNTFGNLEASNSMYSDDDNSCSTGFSKASDYSDNDPLNNSEHSGKGKTKRKERKDPTKKTKAPKEKASKSSLLKEKLQQGLKEKMIGKTKEKNKSKNVSSPIISTATIAELSDKSNPEKIKLRLKLEKSEPVTSAYKVDVSFGESSKRSLTPNTSKVVTNTSNSTSSAHSNTSHNILGGQQPNSNTSGTNEELRVPPLHISLRGRNSVVIKNSKKTRKKSQSGGGGGDDEERKSSNKKSHIRAVNATNVDADSSKIVNNLNSSQPMDALLNCNLNASQNTSEISKTISSIEPNLESIRGGLDSNRTSDADSLQQEKLLNSASNSAIQSGLAKRGPETNATSNGPVIPEKKRRLSDTAAIPSSSSLSTSNDESNSNNNSSKRQYLDSSVESIREAIGSTNVGTLPKHSQLTSTIVQKTSNNNNNNLTLNKVKSTNKLKPKTETIDSTKPNDISQQKIADAINLDQMQSSWHSTADHNVAPIKNSQNESKSNAAKIDEKTNADLSQLSNQIQMKTHDDISDTNENKSQNNNSTTNGAIQKSTMNTQIINRSAEIKDSPRRDVIEGLINASQAIRCSPASQAQGEDSGIESMDALSEKSPHQTASPMANDIKQVESSKEVVPKSTNENLDAKENISNDKFSNIEAALAKMEGLNDFMTSDCDKGSAHVEIESNENQKLNGEHFVSANDDQVQRLVNDLVESKIENSDMVIALKDNIDSNVENEFKPSANSTRKSECKDMNENKTILELTDIQNDEKSHIDITNDTNIVSIEVKEEIATFDENRNDDTKTNPSELIKSESTATNSQDIDQKEIAEDPDTKIELSIEMESFDTDATILENDDIDKSNIEFNDGNSVEDKEIEDVMQVDSLDPNVSPESDASKLILQQLSIEIPNNDGDNAQRVRTRASSKLESPSDALKQSPSDSPASSSSKIPNKTMKRKRQESESSIQSSISDDMPTRGKKPRKSGDMTASSSRSSSPTNVMNGNDFENVSNRRSEESSDSDEPLIEVAGKVRNAKMCKVGSEGDKNAPKNYQKATIAGTSVQTSNISQQPQQGSSSDVQAKQTSSQVNKIDDKSSTMSTRRSVRMNATVAKVSKSMVNHEQTNATNSIANNSNDNNTETPRKSGNGTGNGNILNVTEATDARRKTRSAVLESAATEGRRRRLSKDNK